MFVYWASNLVKYQPEEFHALVSYKISFVILMFDYPLIFLLNPLIYYFGLFQTQIGISIVGFILSFQWWVFGYIIELLVRGVKKLIRALFN